VSSDGLPAFVAAELTRRSDPEKAAAMAAYMKTDMPFFGVTKPDRTPVLRQAVRDFPPQDSGGYRTNVLALWSGGHREEKYLAIGYARHFDQYITSAHVDLYRQMVEEGSWWDLVDDIAIHLIGRVVLAERPKMRPILDRWNDGPDMWLRRTAILCQLRHKADTDERMLFDFCRRRAHEKEFFIRKAIGWALREYSKTSPEAVRRFLEEEGERLSGLSRREASRYL
jgi:3-methyladenine DNA glycosylase AlkD